MVTKCSQSVKTGLFDVRVFAELLTCHDLKELLGQFNNHVRRIVRLCVVYEVTEEAECVSQLFVRVDLVGLQLLCEEGLRVVPDRLVRSIFEDVAQLSGKFHDLRSQFGVLGQLFLHVFKVLLV